jgi:WD40 repeat protein
MTVSDFLKELPSNLIWMNSHHAHRFDFPISLIFFTPKHILPNCVIDDFLEGKECRGKIGICISTKKEYQDKEEEELERKYFEFLIMKLKMNFPVAFAKNDFHFEKISPKNFPSIFIIDKSGEIKERAEGYIEIYNLLPKKTDEFLSDEFFENGQAENDEFDLDNIRRERAKNIPSEEKIDFVLPSKMGTSNPKKIIAIADVGKNNIVLLNRWFEIVDIIGNENYNSVEGMKIRYVDGLRFSKDGRKLFICDFGDSSVKIIDIKKRKVLGVIDIPFPTAVDIYGKSGEELYVSSFSGKIFRVSLGSMTKEVLRLDSDGFESGYSPFEKYSLPSDLLIKDNKIFFTDLASSSVKVFELSRGVARTIAGGLKEGHKDGPVEKTSFNFPCSIDSYKDAFFISDVLNGSVRILFENRVSTFLVRNFKFIFPECVRIFLGSIIVSDTPSRKVISVHALSLEGEEITPSL